MERFPRCDPPWGITSIIMVLALYLVVSFGLGVAVALVQPHPDQFALLLISLAGEVLLAVLVLCIAGIRYRSSLKILGISGSSRRDLFYYGLLGGLGGSFVMIIAMKVFFSLYHLQPEPQPVVSLIVSSSNNWWLLLGCLMLAGVVAPICEELYFRGFVYPVLRHRFGMSPAVLITSCLFAAVHFDPARFLFLALLGAFLAVVCEKTRSLLPAIAAHSVYNLVSIVLLFL